MEDTNINVNTDTNIDATVVDAKVDESKVEDTKVEEVKTLNFTQAELDALINKRLDRANKKAEEVKAEAEKLAKMSEGERQQALFDAEKASFAEERKQYQSEKLELQVVKELSTKGLPTEFSKYLIGADAQTCMDNIKEFETQWSQSIANAIDNKLKGVTPKVGTGKVGTMTKEDFNKMGYKEKSQLFTDNNALYMEMLK